MDVSLFLWRKCRRPAGAPVLFLRLPWRSGPHIHDVAVQLSQNVLSLCVCVWTAHRCECCCSPSLALKGRFGFHTVSTVFRSPVLQCRCMLYIMINLPVKASRVYSYTHNYAIHYRNRWSIYLFISPISHCF